jgi:hypothetical protein
LRTKMLLILIVALIIPAGAKTARDPFYDFYIHNAYPPYQIANRVEESGLPVGGRTISIDRAWCVGLRRYGVQKTADGGEVFKRFRCVAIAADDTIWRFMIYTKKGHFFAVDVRS